MIRTGALLLSLLLPVGVASAPVPLPVPVQVGGDEDMDACPSLAQVGGAKSGFISVRSGPDASYPEIGRLPNGHYAYTCDESGEWEGIVYGSGKEPVDCGVGSPVVKRIPYAGSCRSGWVRRKWLTVVAG